MPYVYLISSVFFMALYSILGSFYNNKNKKRGDASSLYTLILTCSAFLFWLVLFLIERAVNAEVLWYSLLFAFCYTVVNIALINALKTGSVILTSLFLQFSLIGVTIWGFFFWNTQFTWLRGVGLFLVAVALWLCLYTGKSGEKKKFSLKWIFFVIVIFVGNAGCAIVQKTQQMRFDGKYGIFMMMIASAISLIACLILYLRSNKSESLIIFKTSWYYPVLAGLCNGMLSLLVIILATSSLSPSLIYPVLAIGTIAVITIASVFVFKERMRWWQWVGIFVGSVAVGILSV